MTTLDYIGLAVIAIAFYAALYWDWRTNMKGQNDV